MIKRILRILFLVILTVAILALLAVTISVAPIDRTPVSQLKIYDEMMRRLDSIPDETVTSFNTGFRVGYSRVNFTPSFPTATAGYGKRRGKPFTTVHDSVFVRTMVISNGVQTVAIVSADLLIIPPTVTALLKNKLPEIGFSLDNTYLGATHSHNSVGNWGEGITTFLYGSYEDSVVNLISGAILKSIQQASSAMLPATLRTGLISIPQAVENRMIDGGPEDPFFRVLEAERSDSSKLLFSSFTAHATCLYSRDLELSRDYPGKLVDIFEAQGYNFAMFMAGAVGSHGCTPEKFGWDCIDWMAENLSERFLRERQQLTKIDDSTLKMERVELLLPEPQAKISENWKIRSWVFRKAFGEYPADLTALRIGSLVMLGTPCDFSGEFDHSLDSIGGRVNTTVMVTSFNGGYIGYVTPARYYDVDHYETRLMNWYPPGNGEYISLCLGKLILRSMDR